MDSEEGIPASEPVEENSSAEETGAGNVNYHDRIRVEPDFAVDEVRKKDKYINELHTKVNKLKGLEQYVDAVGDADSLIELASLGHNVRSNPSLYEALQNALNGKAPAQSEPEEEIYDPEVKMVNAKIAEQNQIIRDLQNRLNQTEVVGLKASLGENVAQALTTFESDPDLLEEAKGEIQRAVKGLEKAAANGDRSAQQQLSQLAAPGGSKTLRMMTLDIYDKYVEKRLATNTDRPDGEAMRSKATDARHVTRAGLPTDVVAVKSGVKVTSQLVDEVMAKITAQKGKDPNAFWSH